MSEQQTTSSTALASSPTSSSSTVDQSPPPMRGHGGKTPVVVMYIGYAPAFNGDDWKTNTNIGGSEIAAANLVTEIKRQRPELRIVVLGFMLPNEGYVDKHGVEWLGMTKNLHFFEKTQVDVCIISRYVNAFLHVPFIIRSKKIFVWVHDVVFHSAYRGVMMEDAAGRLMKTFSKKIDGVMYQSPWHLEQLQRYYGCETYKYYELPNGCDSQILDIVNQSPVFTKHRYRFVWTAHHDRNIENIIEMWPLILAKLPSATLVVCGEKTPKTRDATELFANEFSQSVKLLGKVSHEELFHELAKSDVWFYPTEFCETYCMSALEAQLAQCLCIAYNVGCLNTTVGADRGYIFTFPKNAPPPSKHAIVNVLVDIISSPEKKQQNDQLRHNAQTWARTQTWENRAKEWLRITSL